MLWAQESAGLCAALGAGGAARDGEVGAGSKSHPGTVCAGCGLMDVSWSFCTAVSCAQGSLPGVPYNRLPSLHTRWLNVPAEKWLQTVPSFLHKTKKSRNLVLL